MSISSVDGTSSDIVYVTNQGVFLKFIDDLGHRAIRPFVYTLEVLRLVYLSGRAILFDHSQSLRSIFSVVSSQVYFTGWQAMPLITMLALATGGASILQTSMQLTFFGNASMLGNLLIVIIVREVGPLLTALIVIARSGTAVASEIGNMRANREIEALETMGINPLSYIVFPRILGGMISVLCLAFYFSAIALFGGHLVAQMITKLPLSFFIETLAQAFSMEDAAVFLIKNSFSGLIIFMVSCYQGLSVKQSSHEVPQVTTNAVVNSIVYVTIFHALVTTFCYLNQLTRLGLL